MTGPRVLFVSHDASLTGAPMHVVRLVRWLARNQLVDPHILLLDGGPLTAAFEDLGPTTSLGGFVPRAAKKVSDGGKRVENVIGRLGARAGQSTWSSLLSRAVEPHGRPDLVYVNSLLSGAGLMTKRLADIPVLTHVHELGFSIDHILDRVSVELALDRGSAFIACGREVEDDLRRRLPTNTPLKRIPELCENTEVRSEEATLRWRQENSVPADAILIGGLGSRGWRKGADLFIGLGRTLPDRLGSRPIVLSWVGRGQSARHDAEYRYDISRLGLERRVRLLDVESDPSDFLSACDLIAVTSREDPYPLVCAEAGMQRTPVICFESGGAAEFARSGGGEVVAYADIAAMAQAILNICGDEGDLRRHGVQAREFASLHTPDALGPLFFDEIHRALAG